MLDKAVVLLDREATVASEVTSSLIPVLSVWLVKDISLDRLINPILKKLEGSQALDQLTSVLKNLEVLTPYISAELLQGCPQSEEDFTSNPLPNSLEITFGATLVPFWNNFNCQPSFEKPWPALASSLAILSRLAAALELLPMEQEIIGLGGSLAASLLSVLGREFALSTLLPLFESKISTGALLPMLVAGMQQTSLSSSALPLIKRHLPPPPGKVNPGFQEAVSILANSSERAPLADWLAGLAREKDLQQRLEATELVELLLPQQVGNDVWPVIEILIADSESEVVVASLSPLSRFLASPELTWEEKERACFVLTNLIQDPRDNVVTAAISHIGAMLTSWHSEGRDELLLVPLASVPLQWKASPRSPCLHAALLAALAIVPELVTTEAVLSGHVLPGLVVLLELVREEQGMEEAVLMVMAEVEGSRRRGAGRTRRESTASGTSGHSAGGGEETKETVKTKVGKLLPKSSSMQLSPFWKK